MAMSNVASLLERLLPTPHFALLERASDLCAQRGLQPFLVGGTVRDLLLGARAATVDLDIAIAGGNDQRVYELALDLGGEVVARSAFGTAKLDVAGVTVDVSMARQESYAHAGALPKVAPGTLDQDLARRDFTINAMAISLSAGQAWGELFDPFDGRQDLRRRLIRVLHPESFVDDPTRIPRAVRYAVRLEFALDDETRRLIERDCAYVQALTGDRARHELERIFRERAASSMLALAKELGILSAIHPALDAGHRVLTELRGTQAAPIEENDIRFIAALSFSASDASRGSLTARLNMNTRWSKVVMDVGRLRGAFGELGAPDLRRRQVYDVVRRYDVLSVEVCALLADDTLVRKRLRLYLDDLRHVRPILKGGDLLRLGVPEGPAVGKLLDELLLGRIEGLLETRQDEENLVTGFLQRQAW